MRALLSKPAPEGDPPSSPQYAGVRKRAHVPIACQACRRRKIKCDDRRPRCTPCVMSNQECRFAVSDKVAAQRDDLVIQVQAATRKHSHMRAVIEALRGTEGEQLEDILRRIRSAGSVDDFLDMVGDASLLLQPVHMDSSGQDASNYEASQSSLAHAPAPGSSARDRSSPSEYDEAPSRPRGLDEAK